MYNNQNRVAFAVNCSCCNEPIKTVTSYDYNWNEKKPIDNYIYEAKITCDGYQQNDIGNSRHYKHYVERVYANKKHKYVCEYKSKFNGILVDGKSLMKIHFTKLKCEKCLKKALKDKKSFEYKFNKKIQNAKDNWREWNSELSIYQEKNGPCFDNLGCVTFIMTTIYRANTDELITQIESIFKNILDCEFEMVYTCVIRLNPDRDGYLLTVRPIDKL